MEERVQERTRELERERTSLEEKVEERTKELEGARTGLEEKVKERTVQLEAARQGLEEEVEKRTKELQQKVGEMERFQKVTVDRELKMMELKKEIESLRQEG